MALKKSAKPKQIAAWVISTLSLAALLIGVIGAVLSTFSLGASDVQRTDYASAAIWLMCLAFACVILAIGTSARQGQISAVPKICACLLILVGVRFIIAIDDGRQSEFYYPGSNTYFTLLIGMLFSAPLVYVGLKESITSRSTALKMWCVAIAATVPIVLFVALALPLQSKANAEISTNKAEIESHGSIPTFEEISKQAKEAAIDMAKSNLAAGVEGKAKDISVNTQKGGVITYEFLSSTIGPQVIDFSADETKTKATFCLLAYANDDPYYLGVTVDSTPSAGTTYWYGAPTPNDCKYSRDNERHI